MGKNKKGTGKGKKLMMVVLTPILVALGVYLGTYLTGTSVGLPKIRAEEEANKEEVEVGLEEFLLNLEPTGVKRRYIRLEVVLSTTKENGLEEIENNTNRIRDVIIYEVSNESVGNIFDEDGSGFILKERLKEQINEYLGEELVHQVYITNMIVQ